MKIMILIISILISSFAQANETLIREVREYIKIYEQQYPRTELYHDILKLQSSSPEDKLQIAKEDPSQLNQIYDSHELQAWAQRIAEKMDPTGPFNDNYNSTLSGLIKIYLNEPQHRRAIQTLFDVISLTYHSKANKELHYDRMTSWRKHLLDYSEWTWGLAALWSLRTSPTIMSSTKWYLKPINTSLKKIPLPQFYTRLYKLEPKVPIHESHFFKRIGYHLNNNRYLRPVFSLTKDAALFGGVTFGTAAMLGTPSYFIYPYLDHKLDPSSQYLDDKYKESNNLGVKIHQMAILELGCRTLQLNAEIENISLKPELVKETLKLGPKLKAEINDLVDARRYLYEVSHFFASSKELHPDIKWDAIYGTFTLNDKTLICEALKDRARSEFATQALNLNDINRQLNFIIANFDKKFNEFLFAHMDQKVESFDKLTLNNNKTLDSLTQELLINIERTTLSEKSSESDNIPSLEKSSKSVANIMALLIISKKSLFELSASDLADVTIDSEEMVEVVQTLKSYLKKPLFIEFNNSLSIDSKNTLEQLAKDIVYEWPPQTFNAYLAHLMKKYYVAQPQNRSLLIAMFTEISLRLNKEYEKNIIPEINQYIDPLLFISAIHNRQISEIKAKGRE